MTDPSTSSTPRSRPDDNARNLVRQPSAETRRRGPQEEETESPASSSATLTPGNDFDLARAVQYVVRKADEACIKRRTLGVVFEELRVVGLGSVAAHQDTFGSVFSPSAILAKIQAARHPQTRDILSGFTGVVRPGEMLLVLGRPGAGCSTLLRVLSNQRYQFHAVEGQVQYDAFSSEEVERHYRGDVLYCPEDDVHFPTLRVGETVEFAAATRTRQRRIDNMPRKEAVARMTDIATTAFGLSHVLRTPVGDAQIRGVSGGEKKCVSISEAMAARACIAAWDNSTRGLDASTALEFGRAVRLATDTFHCSSIVALYQAGENLYDLFDKVCVIYEGKMAYFGPANRARQYFIDMGYEPASRQSTPDFLVAVTDPLARTTSDPSPNSAPVPRTAEDFAQYFEQSELGRLNRQGAEEYRTRNNHRPERARDYKISAQEEHATTARKASPYIVSVWMQIKAVMQRRVRIMRGNTLFISLNALSFAVEAIIKGTFFLDLPENTSAFFSRSSVMFFALLYTTFTAMSEIPTMYAQRPIIHRQMRNAMYHPFVEAAALTLVDIPLTLAIMTIYTVVLYFLVGLQRSASQFFIFLLFICTVAVVMRAWFRAIAAGFRSEAGAQTIAGISLLVLSIYTGYTIPKASMPVALSWITWLNPVRYGFEALVTNELRTIQGSCSSLIPQGPGYEGVTLANQVCSAIGAVTGSDMVDGEVFAQLSYGYEYTHIWRNLGIIFAFGVAFIAALLMFTERNTDMAVANVITLYKRGTRRSIRDPAGCEADAEMGKEKPAGGVVHGKAKAESNLNDLVPASQDMFTWQNLSYDVQTGGGEQRRLLDSVSGYVTPGKLTALMGESGAGKTTLLNILAQRVDVGVVHGDLFINGHPLPSDFQAQTGYCEQTDTHLPQMTVREALLFSAKMRQPPDTPISDKVAYAEKCLKMCGMEDYADAIVGTLGVEHRKRTTIGVELAAKPRLLLFLDEPTSGLDSQSAWAIMTFLRELADAGQAILCTIHQPSAELFQSFDRVLLLRKGGQTVYFGDLGPNSSTLIQYFESNGARTCDEKENPAEYILDVLGSSTSKRTESDWHAIWRESPEHGAVQSEIEGILREGRKRGAVQATIRKDFATGWFYQVYELLARLTVSYWRDPTYVMAKMLLATFSGLIIGFTFYQANDSQQGTQNKLFVLFMAVLLSVPLSNQIQVPYINMRNIYEVREKSSRMYSWTALVTAQILVEIPLNVVSAALLLLTMFWTVGFETSRAGFTFLVFAVAFPLYYQTLSQMVAAMCPSVEIAGLVFSFLASVLSKACGVMQPYRALGWWKWMYRISPFTYLIEALYGQVVGRQTVTCSAVELVSLNPPPGQTCGAYLSRYISNTGGYVVDPSATSGCAFCSTRTTDEFMKVNFNMSYENHWRDFGVVMGFVCLNIFLVFVCTYVFRIRKGGLFALPSFLRRK